MTTSTLTVTEFVTERLYEDEMVARAAGMGMWVAGERCVWRVSTIAELDIVTDGLDGDGGTETPEIATHIARHDPARVLAQCAAMREIVELHGAQRTRRGGSYCPICDAYEVAEGVWGGEGDLGPCDTILALASIWSDHPDWREEWRT